MVASRILAPSSQNVSPSTTHVTRVLPQTAKSTPRTSWYKSCVNGVGARIGPSTIDKARTKLRSGIADRYAVAVTRRNAAAITHPSNKPAQLIRGRDSRRAAELMPGRGNLL